MLWWIVETSAIVICGAAAVGRTDQLWQRTDDLLRAFIRLVQMRGKGNMMISLTDDAVIGPQLDITSVRRVHVHTNGRTLWVDVDGICRLRVCRMQGTLIEVKGKKLFEEEQGAKVRKVGAAKQDAE